MALRGQYTTASRQVSENAYAKVARVDMVRSHEESLARVEVYIWHDEAARLANCPPIDRIECHFFERPNVPSSLWDALDGATEEQRNAVLERQLGKNWLLEHPTVGDLFAVEKLDEFNQYALFYDWAAQYHPLLKGWENA